MKRRELLAAAGMAAATASAQDKRPTVYIPKNHRVEDVAFLQDFMDEYAFVDLITASPTLHITHIPALLDRSKGGAYGTVFGHIARNNPQSALLLAGGATATIVFRGPHAYISPAWYAKGNEAVPTWNFAAVHATGVLKPVEDKKQLRALLSRLIAKFEAHMPERSYEFDKLPDSYVNGMLGGIVGFEMPVDQLEGKFKLGQERSEADRTTMVTKLKTSKTERAMPEFTAAFYASRKTGSTAR